MQRQQTAVCLYIVTDIGYVMRHTEVKRRHIESSDEQIKRRQTSRRDATLRLKRPPLVVDPHSKSNTI
jgi:hypothetical protein